MKWSRSNSIRLSKACIWLFGLTGILLGIGLPSVIGQIVRRRGMEYEIGKVFFLTSYYALLVPALIALICLYCLLANIGGGKIFVRSNVRYLRWISWACYVAAFISIISVCYYRPYIVLAGAAGFMGLILRVVKNVFEEAVYIKEENDYTI
ncbi:MAG: DUF2975 domain-containing protein [Sporomusa sp.]